MNKKLMITASLTAMHSLLITSPDVSTEDLLNEAFDIGRQFTGKASTTTSSTSEAVEFVPERGETFYFPRQTRSGFQVDSDIWNNTKNQLALQQLKLCYNDYENCLNHCLMLNRAYGIV